MILSVFITGLVLGVLFGYRGKTILLRRLYRASVRIRAIQRGAKTPSRRR